MHKLAVLLFAFGPAFADDVVCRPAPVTSGLDTAAIQQAIDNCAGKGVVRLDGKAKFVTAPLMLPSHTVLEVASGTTLEGSTDHADYPAMAVFRQPARRPLIYALHAEDIVIRGGGTIDGRGESWWGKIKSAEARPRLIVFDHVKHIVMENITVQN